MNKKNLNNPHDKFFKKVFSDLSVVKDYIEQFFPESLQNIIDIRSLKTQNTTYISDQLGDFFSDIVFEIQSKKKDQKLTISLLLEHKSVPDYNIKMQLLRYKLEIWHQQNINKEQLTPIIPIVFYHGKTKWKKKNFIDYFSTNISELKPFILDFDYILTDLSQWSDFEILKLKKSFLLNALLVMKHRAETQYLVENAALIFKALEENIAENKSKILLLFVYLLQSTDFKEHQIKAFYNNLESKIKHITMSGYDVLIRKGEVKSKTQIIIRSFDKGMDIQLIAEITSWSIEQVNAVLKEAERIS